MQSLKHQDIEICDFDGNSISGRDALFGREAERGPCGRVLEGSKMD